jgi:polysaccharide export outer membrane protein
LKQRVYIFFIIIFSFLLTLNLLSQEETSTEYKIGAKDLLEVRVFGHSELNTTTRVSEEGKISFPLVGEFDVEGLTKAEVEVKLGQLLGEKYLQDPQVTVFILEYQSKQVYVNGAVTNPGAYELVGRQHLMQIISKAGGLTSDAGNDIIVMRNDNNGQNKSLKISIEDLFLKGDAKLNIPLHPNDTIYIPLDELIKIYVTGQVRNAGAIEVKKSNLPNFTLLRAIAQAGGFSERASKGGVIIKRIGPGGKEQVIKVNVKDIIKGKKKDIQLKENDVVYVPETLF